MDLDTPPAKAILASARGRNVDPIPKLIQLHRIESSAGLELLQRLSVPHRITFSEHHGVDVQLQGEVKIPNSDLANRLGLDFGSAIDRLILKLTVFASRLGWYNLRDGRAGHVAIVPDGTPEKERYKVGLFYREPAILS